MREGTVIPGWGSWQTTGFNRHWRSLKYMSCGISHAGKHGAGHFKGTGGITSSSWSGYQSTVVFPCMGLGWTVQRPQLNQEPLKSSSCPSEWRCQFPAHPLFSDWRVPEQAPNLAREIRSWAVWIKVTWGVLCTLKPDRGTEGKLRIEQISGEHDFWCILSPSLIPSWLYLCQEDKTNFNEKHFYLAYLNLGKYVKVWERTQKPRIHEWGMAFSETEFHPLSATMYVLCNTEQSS